MRWTVALADPGAAVVGFDPTPRGWGAQRAYASPDGTLQIAALERGEVDAVTVWAPLVAVYGMAGKPGVAFVDLLPAMAFAWVLYRVLWHREVFAPDRA